MNDIRLRLVKCFAAVFPELDDREIAVASTASVNTWDSLASVTLLSVLEEEFQVQIDPEELEHFVSFDAIFDYLQHAQQAL
jgi:acyl carrier protein